MIKTIIFDFGDVFINLDKNAPQRNFKKLLGITELNTEMSTLNDQYEMGLISTDSFVEQYINWFPKLKKQEFIHGWNSMLLDFPKYRLEFLKTLSSQNKYKLILLSNTNELHISWIIKNVPFYKAFKSCFDHFYLSHEIHLRKPNADIFQYVLNQHELSSKETLFIDDTLVNTESASLLGIHVWNNDPQKEDIIDLFTHKASIF